MIKSTYLIEIIFPTDRPNKEFMDEIEKLAYLKGIELNVIGDYYKEV